MLITANMKKKNKIKKTASKKAVTKKSAKKKLAISNLKKGTSKTKTKPKSKPKTEQKNKTTSRRIQARGSLTYYNRVHSRTVLESFVKLFAFEIPKEKKTDKKGRGRPSVMTDKVLRKLETAFAYDCTVEEACLFGGIAPVTYYEFVKKYPDFTKTIELLRNIPFLLARQTIVEGIMNNYSQAMDYMSRKRKTEFSHKLELAHEGGIKHTHDIDPKAKEAVDNIFALFENKAREVSPKVIVKDDD